MIDEQRFLYFRLAGRVIGFIFVFLGTVLAYLSR
jgi:hypothetical protein